MLTLTRRSGERIRIGEDIIVTVREIHGNQVKLGIEAPRDIHVYREELYLKIVEANRAASLVSLQELDTLLPPTGAEGSDDR